MMFMARHGSLNRSFGILLGILISPMCHILHTQTWQWVNPIPTGDVCISLYFVDSLRGWILAGGSGTLVRTSDGGETWQYQFTGLRTYYQDAYFADANYGWVVGGDSNAVLSRTTDGGKSWLTKSFPPYSSGSPLFYFKSARFFGPDTGVASTEFEFLLTTDGGNTWMRRPINGKLRQISAVSCLDWRNAYVLSDSLYKTSDAGSTWETIA